MKNMNENKKLIIPISCLMSFCFLFVIVQIELKLFKKCINLIEKVNWRVFINGKCLVENQSNI